MCWMDAGAIKAAGTASTASYRSFADATRSVLDLLERLLPDCALYLSHLDRAHAVHRIVDTRAGAALGLRSNLATPLEESYDIAMADERAPRLCNDLSAEPAYAGVGMQRRAGAGSYLGVPLELSDGSRVGALAALSERAARFRPDDEQLFTMLARVLAYELERESNERDLRRLNDSLRDHARGMGAVGRVVRVLAGGEDGRRAVCRAACELANAPVAFLLEPSGREFVSTAMSGVDMPPVTIQPRAETTGRAFTARESYFVADARAHRALAAPLGEATSGMLRLLAAQAAVAIEHAGLRARMETLTLTDELTGVATRRVFDEELPRELARARRSDYPLAVATIDLDHLGAFNMLRGEREGDRLIKETAALWRNELREVDTLARLEGGLFAAILPNCGLGEAIEVLDRVRAGTARSRPSC